MDDGEAKEGNDTVAGKTRQLFPTRRGVRLYEGLLVRLPSPQGLASGGNSRGGEASAVAQPATGGRSRRHDRRCFGRLEQEDQRLKKHYDRWMDIIRSLELESFILTKVDKGPRPSQLSRPTSQPPTMVGPW